ncbi:MAG: serine protease [Planctomycetota bacterium]
MLAEDPDRWDRVICLNSTPNGNATSAIASAFIVSYGEKLLIVTAAHAAKQTHQRTRLLFRSIDGTPQWVNLGLLTGKNQDPWIRHKNSDIATAKIVAEKKNAPYLTQLNEIAIPLEDVLVTPVERTTKIESVGFPLGLGLQEQVSPIVVVGHVASKEILTTNDWGSEPLIYSYPDLAQGTSGGPTFLSEMDAKSTKVVGMHVAVIYDASGGKLSKLIPSRIIREAIVARCEDE